MILHVSPEDLSPGAVKAVMRIDKTLSGFPLEDRVILAATSFLGVLRELRCVGQQDPDRRRSYDTFCGDVQAWLRREIETLRFEKSH